MKYRYQNITLLKNFLNQENIKKLINENDFISILSNAVNNKVLITTQRWALLSDLITLFYNMQEQNEYIPNCWVIINIYKSTLSYNFLFSFIDKPNLGPSMGTIDINGVNIYNSFEEADEALKKGIEHWNCNPDEFKILGLCR